MKKNKAINFIAGFVFIVSFTVIIGWTFDVTSLISITPNMTAMNPLTAICFMFIAIWLFAENYSAAGQRLTRLQEVIATFILLTGVIKLMEYGRLTNFHIDGYLFRNRLNSRFLHNAIAPTTALLFTLMGILFLNAHIKGRVSRTIHDVVIVAAFLISYLGAIGYIYSLEPFYRIGPFVPMALNTAACFMTSFFATFLVLKKGNIYHVISSRELGGKLSRRAIPFMLLIPPVFGYIGLILQRARAYDTEYGVTLDTAFMILLVLTLVYHYAKALNKKDIERKQAEKSVTENEEKYRSLIFALKEGVVYYTGDGTIIFCNNSFCKILGYEQEELIGKNIVDILSTPEQKEDSRRQLEERRKGISEDYETQIIHKDGLKICVHINARQIIEQDKPIAFFSTVTDISERKRQEEDIEAFSASAAHDLNAPLARIEMLATFITDFSADRLNEEDLSLIRSITKTSSDMRTMLKDLLLFSRIGVEKIDKQPIDMKDMATKVVETSLFLNPKAEVHVENLPTAYGDPRAVKHVWDNLILNAIKYSSKKDKAVVDIGTSEIDGHHVYYVKDNGAGFDMNSASKLFAPFKRLHSDFEGNGLGLPIAKRIVEKHGGKIWAASEAGKGATFYFTL